MRASYPAVAIVCISVTILSGCAKRGSDLTSTDKQRLNRALTYFVYAQANRQLVHVLPGFFSPRNTEMGARRWVISGIQQPQQIVSHDKVGGHAGFVVGFDKVGISGGGALEHWYVANPKAPLSDLLVQLFNNAPSRWDAQRKVWHLPMAYVEDYEWARNEDRFKFFLAFYQDPYPGTVIR